MGDCNSFVDWFGVFLGGLGLVVSLIPIPLARMESRSNIAQFRAVQATFETARQNKNISPIELAAIQQNAMKANADLASWQYWNQTVFDWWIDDGVMDLKPIK